MIDHLTIEPTWRDRLYIRVWYPIRHDWPTTIQRTIADKMPRWLVYFVTIRVFAAASTDKHPDDLTFSEVIGPWEKRSQEKS